MFNLLYKIIFIFCCCIALPVSSAPVMIQSESMKISLEQVADSLGIPWGLSFLSDNQLLVSERDGAVQLLDVDNGQISRLKNVPAVLAEGQGGMLDIAISPEYKKHGWIYFTYVKDIDGSGVTVYRALNCLTRHFLTGRNCW